MCVILFLLLVYPSILASEVFDDNHWKKTSYDDLQESLHIKHSKRVAKNVILFIGDGMGPNTITAARIYKESKEGYLYWEKFDHVGALKTYSNNKLVTDPGCSATALFAGVKANSGTLGLSSDVKRNDCFQSIIEGNRVITIAKMAQDAGKATGIVTNGRITHATTAAMYAHSANKDWECDTNMPYIAPQCKDIARQLVEDEPGKNFNVIMGGGRQQLMTDSPSTLEDPVEGNKTSTRADNRNLIAEWIRQKEVEGVRYTIPKTKKELLGLDPNQTDYLLGIFQNDHFPFASKVNYTVKNIPSLEEMATTAVKVLSNNKRGFVLMVANALINKAHQSRRSREASDETFELSKAVEGTMKLLEAAGIKNDTLVIVTSSHSDTLTISGTPDVGSDILETPKVDITDGAVLDYATVKKNNYFDSAVSGGVVREDTILKENTNGGNDVFVYATGPYAYLFHRIHEQTYVPEVIQYASRIGHHSHQYHLLAKARHSGSSTITSSIIVITAVQLIFRLFDFM